MLATLVPYLPIFSAAALIWAAVLYQHKECKAPKKAISPKMTGTKIVERAFMDSSRTAKRSLVNQEIAAC